MEGAFVNLGGDEMELRPLTARQYLAARLEASRLGESEEYDDTAKAVLLGAALLSKGVFLDGERVFPSIGEVLDSLTAQEIVETAVYVELEPKDKERAAEIMTRSVMTDSQLTSDAAREREDEGADESGGKRKDERGEVQTTARRVSYVNRSHGVEKYSGGDFNEVGRPGKNVPFREDMRRVSEFFRRDSRRYDANISKY